MVQEGVITEAQLISAYDRQILKQSPLKEALIDLTYVTEDDIMGAIVGHFGFTYFPLQNYTIEQHIINLVPEEKCRQHKLIPVSLSGNLLTIAISNLLDIIALDDVALATDCEVIPVMSKEQEIEDAIAKYYGKQLSIDEIVKDENAPSEIKKQEENIDISGGAKSIEIKEAPIINLANHIIATAIKKRASDIHIEPQEKQVNVRYRIDGMLIKGEENLPKMIQPLIISRFKIMSKMDIAEHRVLQDGRIRITFENRPIDLRVSSLPVVYGEKIVIRILDRSNLKVKLEDLGLDEQALNDFRECIDLPYGLLLVTGPTGSGKTTTLYSALNYLNKPDSNVVTVEDPVEYEMANINQVQIIPEAGMTFASALRSILRQDPDKIMIGEIRDKETLDIAIKSALIGHLVLSTLHTNDATSTVMRMIDMGGESYLIASALQMILAQRLLRKLCDECKEPYSIPEELLSYFDGFDPQPQELFRPQGCPKCFNTGMRGRVAAMEMFKITNELKDLITSGATANVLRGKALALGMKTLRQNAFEKVDRGIVSLEEALTETT